VQAPPWNPLFELELPDGVETHVSFRSNVDLQLSGESRRRAFRIVDIKLLARKRSKTAVPKRHQSRLRSWFSKITRWFR
jgi:hypothetical protein